MSPFAGIFVPAEVAAEVSDRAWLTALLDAERALANAEAATGVIPPAAAAAIAEACHPEHFDPERLAEEGRAAGNPVEPLVRALAAVTDAAGAPYVHWGATSQDIMDSAAMLVARRALGPILAELDRVVDVCTRLAAEHRETVMPARTLLQQAVPTTFGLKAAGWLAALTAARERLSGLRASGLAAQLGGAAGTLAALGESGLAVARQFALELELAEAPLPWQSDRTRVAELGAALASAASTLAKIGLDVALLEQTEVGEVSEPAGAGGSSAMPGKRNPVGSALAGACARHVRACAATLNEAMVGEHERSLGAWQSEWGALSDALAYTAGAAQAIATSLEGLRVEPEQMARNLTLTGGAIVAERVALVLTPLLGRAQARALVADAAERSGRSGRTLEQELRSALPPGAGEELANETFDPGSYLGSAAELVDRALGLARRDGEDA